MEPAESRGALALQLVKACTSSGLDEPKTKPERRPREVPSSTTPEMKVSERSVPLLAVDDKADDINDAELDMGEDDEAQGSSVQAFLRSVRMAFGTGCVCLLTALPVLVPSWYRSIDPNYSGLIGGGTVLIVVFTVYGNVGLTIQLVYQGIIGTFIACLPVHFCSVMMPGSKEPKCVHSSSCTCCQCLVNYPGALAEHLKEHPLVLALLSLLLHDGVYESQLDLRI